VKRLAIMIIGLLFAAKCMAGTTHYVSLTGTNNSPFLNWPDASTNIQHAISASIAGDTVLVSNGTYYLTNQISIATAITCTSVNGRSVTIVDGNNYSGKLVTNRCFSLNAIGAVLDGFTITNGYCLGSGGGINVILGTVRNCLITGNLAGGVEPNGGGIAFSSTYNAENLVENCIVENNNSLGSAGGIFGWVGGRVVNCIIRNNKTRANGGGIRMYGYGWLVKNCLIYNNYNTNSAYFGGGIHIGDGASNSLVVNCTIVSNYSQNLGGGVYVKDKVDTNTFLNCIIYSNACANGSSTNGNIYDNWYPTNSSPIFSYCCSTSNRTFSSGINNNTTNEPIMTDWANQNYRLRMRSPCVNTGTNQDWMTNAVDLEGHARILNNIVDMGAYETILWQGTIYKFGF